MKFLLSITFLIASFNLWAEWSKLGRNVHGNTIYIDYDNIQSKESFVLFTFINDYPTADQYGVLSSKGKIKVDCEKKRFQFLELSHYKKNMAEGESASSFQPSPAWKYPAPKTLFDASLEYVCEKASEKT